MPSAVRSSTGIALSCVALVAAWGPPADAAAYRSCRPVMDPYPGTRYEGEDLRQIRALRVSCATARGVARGAHREALESAPPPSGIRRFEWRGWRVRGDLRRASDRYLATKGGRRVRWVF